jgi:hypothetical protein
MDDQAYYNIVALELRDQALRPGLWARAVAETGDEDSQARARYIRLRVAELMKERERLRLLAKLEKDKERERETIQKAAQREKANTWFTIGFATVALLTLFAVLLKYLFY